MKHKQRKILLGIELSLAVFALAGVTFNANLIENGVLQANANDMYTIRFDKDKILYSSDSMSSTTYPYTTNYGNEIRFKAFNMRKPSADGQWQSFGSNGGFENRTQISGIEQIKISVDGGHKFQIQYSHFFQNFNEYKVYNGSETSEYTITFDTIKPNYFRLINLSDSLLKVVYLEIEYSCTDSSIGDGTPVVGEEYKYGFYPQTLDEENRENIYQASLNTNNTTGDYVIYDHSLYQPLEVNGTTQYFKVEPVIWLVLGENEQGYEMVSKTILDAQAFSTKEATETYYPSNYEQSDIRDWLNDTMYVTLFNKYYQNNLVNHNTDNSASTTRDVYQKRSDGADNPYVCENTKDYVYLLAYVNFDKDDGYKDLLNTQELRKAETSDYYDALMGNTNTYAPYWTRSPNNDGDGSDVSYIGSDGTLYGGQDASNVLGVRPAITIKKNN